MTCVMLRSFLRPSNKWLLFYKILFPLSIITYSGCSRSQGSIFPVICPTCPVARIRHMPWALRMSPRCLIYIFTEQGNLQHVFAKTVESQPVQLLPAWNMSDLRWNFDSWPRGDEGIPSALGLVSDSYLIGACAYFAFLTRDNCDSLIWSGLRVTHWLTCLFWSGAECAEIGWTVTQVLQK